MYCFWKAEESELLKKASAYLTADEAANKLSQIDDIKLQEVSG